MACIYTEKYRSKKGWPDVPMISAFIKRLDGSDEQEANFIIDSGADVSFISRKLFQDLKLSRKGQMNVTKASGNKTPSEWCLCIIRLPQLNLEKKIKVFITDNKDIELNLLGRDIINAYILILNGRDSLYKFYA